MEQTCLRGELLMTLHLQEQLPAYKQPIISANRRYILLGSKKHKKQISSDNPNVLVMWFSYLAIDSKYIYI
jgi:hypothetical protein